MNTTQSPDGADRASRALTGASSTAVDPPWRTQEFLLMRQVMQLIGKSLAPERVLREMLHLLSELLGLNRGRIVLADDVDSGVESGVGIGVDTGSDDPRGDATGAMTTDAVALRAPVARVRRRPPRYCAIRYAYGLTGAELERGRYGPDEGVTGRVLATGQPVIVQDIDVDPLPGEPRFLGRAVTRSRLPQETVAFLALPITIEHRTIGVLAAHRIRSRQRSLDDDVAVMRILATLTGQLLQLHALVVAKTRALETRNAQLTQALSSAAARYGIIGTSTPLLQALAQLERVSASVASVLLLGESGTGKELFARAVHLASPRSGSPFIKVNCAAIPDTLFESELFGHERGAFTGAASARAGWVEQAHQGSLFLDEIGELPLALQTKLLRTLQEGTIVRLGGRREITVDVRVIAATNRDLAREVEAGRFRRDLYYRLNVVPIRLPSLVERREDIRPIALHCLNRVNQQNQRNVALSPGALDALMAHDWPGNIRELANLIERLVLLSDDGRVDAEAIDRLLRASHAPARPAAIARPDELTLPAMSALPAIPTMSATPATPGTPLVPLVRDYRALHSHSEQTLRDAMLRHGNNQSRAAQSLGLSPRQFGYRWKRLTQR